MMQSERLSSECVCIMLRITPRYVNNPYEPRLVMPGSTHLWNKIRQGEKYIFLIHKDEPKSLGVLCGWLQGMCKQYMYAEAGVGEHHVVGINFEGNSQFEMYLSLAFKKMVVW